MKAKIIKVGKDQRALVRLISNKNEEVIVKKTKEEDMTIGVRKEDG